MIAIAASATLSAKTERQLQTSSSMPEESRPRTALPPATPAQMLTALVRSAAEKVPVIVDRVAGITSAAPTPSTARRAISSWAPPAVIATADADAEDAEPDQEHQPSTEPVADSAGRQQQRGEDERVGVDDPRQLGLVGVGGPRDVGQRDVQRRHGRDDSRERDAHDAVTARWLAPDAEAAGSCVTSRVSSLPFMRIPMEASSNELE